MRRKSKVTNIYVTSVVFIILFIIIIIGIINNALREETEGYNNEITKLENEILTLPDSDDNTKEYEYELYIVSQDTGLYDLAIKLKINPMILAYNIPLYY